MDGSLITTHLKLVIKVSLANGGSNSIQNLRPICKKCNREMGSKNWRDFIKERTAAEKKPVVKKKPKKRKKDDSDEGPFISWGVEPKIDVPPFISWGSPSRDDGFFTSWGEPEQKKPKKKSSTTKKKKRSPKEEKPFIYWE